MDNCSSSQSYCIFKLILQNTIYQQQQNTVKKYQPVVAALFALLFECVDVLSTHDDLVFIVRPTEGRVEVVVVVEVLQVE